MNDDMREWLKARGYETSDRTQVKTGRYKPWTRGVVRSGKMASGEFHASNQRFFSDRRPPSGENTSKAGPKERPDRNLRKF